MAAAVYNSNPWRSKDAQALQATDFVPEFHPQISQITQKRQSPEEHLAILKEVAATLKQKSKRRRIRNS